MAKRTEGLEVYEDVAGLYMDSMKDFKELKSTEAPIKNGR